MRSILSFPMPCRNVIRRLVSHRGQIWTIGEGGIEVVV